MNKAELIKAMSEKTGLTKKDTESALAAFTSTVKETLRKGDSVSLIGFGTFEVRKRSARVGRNPQTGQLMEIRASNSPAFKPGKAFKDALK